MLYLVFHLSFFFNFILFFNFTILYWFCHISTWIRHRYTHVPHPEPSSLLPPHTIPLGHPSAPAPSIQYRASNLVLNFTILYWFCHISKWIRHRYTCVPHPELSSFLPPHTIPLGRPSAPAPSIQYRASNLDWRLIPYMILYVLQCHSPKSSYPLPLPQSPKDCSIHQCLFCCLLYRVIVMF